MFVAFCLVLSLLICYCFRLLATRPFKFVVGHSAILFFIHQGVVSRLSAPLKAIVNSGAMESPEDCVVWEDIDASVFSRFAQFAYTGTYTSFVFAGTRSSEGVSNTTVNAAEMLPDRSNPEKPLQGLFSYCTTTPQVGVGDGGALPGPQETDTAGPFKLPYSLASYERAATDRIIPHSHSELCGRSNSLFGSKRKRDMPCDCGPGSGGGPSAKKRNLTVRLCSRIWSTRALRV